MAVKVNPLGRNWPEAFQHMWATSVHFIGWNVLNMIPSHLAKTGLYKEIRSVFITVDALEENLKRRKAPDSVQAQRRYAQVVQYMRNLEYDTDVLSEPQQFSHWMSMLFAMDLLWTDTVMFCPLWAAGFRWVDVKKRVRKLCDKMDPLYPNEVDRGCDMYHDLADIMLGQRR